MELNAYLSAAQQKRAKRRRSRRIAFFVAAAVAMIVMVVWLIAWSPVTRMNGIVVRGAASVTDDQVAAVADAAFKESRGFWKFLGIKNMLAWPSSIPSSALALEPGLETASLEKSYKDHVVTVTVTEREPVAIWCVMPSGVSTDPGAARSPDELCAWFNQAGILFAQTFDTEGAMLFAIHDYSDSKLGLGDTILPDRFIANMFSILAVVRASGLAIKEVRLNDLSLEEIEVTTYNGPDLRFSLRFPAENTLAVLRNIMAKPGFNKLQYIDFRTENRAYYQ
jgi:hypothetical protein